MSVTYKPAPPVEAIARKLIGKHHTDLADVSVEFVFRSEHAERHGHAVLGKARKVSGLNAFLMHWGEARAVGEQPLEGDDSVEAFFVIEIAEDLWWMLSPAQKEALVDHELSHCRTKVNKDEEVVLFVAPHDVEEFGGVAERHGAWKLNLAAFLHRMTHGGQLSFEDLQQHVEKDEDGEPVSITDSPSNGTKPELASVK